MKTTVCTILLVLTGLSVAIAQTEKGRWTVGAAVGNLSYQDQYAYKTFSANLTPAAGYFLATGLVIGTGIPLSFERQKGNGFATKYTATETGLSPFVRYYMGSAALKPYVGVAYSYTRLDRHYNLSNTVISGKGHSSAIAPTVGIAYFINRNVALNAGLNYNIETNEIPFLSFADSSAPAIFAQRSKDKSFSLNIGFQLFFGK
ncbi:outer membrane beta-barrel protein [Spirosoma utsteinense]|uniref:Outer membrane protein n=1 Tax=Spirosoma utsteinense TaxID=2585773 RepID=A0ABR6WED7_9BACT|nr:outer membrane beta-barrel protein [Spirosoma utsteinense]MBC3788961.1 outer membrane protein [Spirosoma utsteinense]MBC3794911.1 outer membrane protein [Spirosoma utsteinense]